MRSAVLAALPLTAVLLAACGGTGTGSAAGTADSSDRLAVAAGFYPYAFVTERVGGDRATVTNLTSGGGEPHDLELTPQQVAALGETDLVVYSKGFQPAVDEAVEQQAAGRGFDVLTAVPLRDSEGRDPHVWLDPMRLGTVAGAVADQLAELDPDGAAGYQERAKELQDELTALDAELRTGLSSCARTEVVTSHDAFGYLTDAYGLEQLSIAGLSPEDEASPKRLAELAVEAEEKGVTTVFFEELVSPKVAESLAREVGAEAKVLSPLESAPESGDYVSAMQTNLAALRTALDCA